MCGGERHVGDVVDGSDVDAAPGMEVLVCGGPAGSSDAVGEDRDEQAARRGGSEATVPRAGHYLGAVVKIRGRDRWRLGGVDADDRDDRNPITQ